EVHNIVIEGDTTNDGSRVTGIESGVLCGAVPASKLDTVKTSSLGLLGLVCKERTLLDTLAIGCKVGSIQAVVPTQPNVDIEGDGIQETVFTSTDGIHIDSCLDGSEGTEISVAECTQDPAMDDAYGVAFSF